MIFKRYILTLVLVAMAAVSRADDPTDLFNQAGKAYDDGNMEQAISLYEQLVTDGYRNGALFFNLGNAYFRSGNTGNAMLNYERAYLMEPRDGDIVANRRFALEHSGAVAPLHNPLTKYIQQLRLSEWIVVTVVAFWLAALATGLSMLKPGWRFVLYRTLWVLAIMFLLGITGIVYWTQMHSQPVMVVMDKAQKALSAPLEGSTALFSIPEGSIVRQKDRSGEWIRIAAGKKEGWLPRSVCRQAYPIVTP